MSKQDRRPRRRGLAPAIALALVAATAAGVCRPGGSTAADTPRESAAGTAARVSELLAAPSRSGDDRETDRLRRPAETLEFFGIAPGMIVADLMAGKGYYTEIVARLVGASGRVYAQNNSISRARHGEALASRLAAAKLDNVVVLDRELEDPGLPAASIDAVLLFQFYHDTFWMRIDRRAMNRAIHEALRPGGVYAIIDHTAASGAGAEAVKTLHRIERDVVVREILDAGFRLEAEHDLLRRNDDTHDLSVFDPAIRGRTDQFMLRFVKP